MFKRTFRLAKSGAVAATSPDSPAFAAEYAGNP